MNKLLTVAGTLSDAPPLPLPPQTPLLHCPLAGPPAGGRGGQHSQASWPGLS